jgi:hypothetical protein
VDTFAAGLVAFILAIQWRWYISVRRDVKLIKKNMLAGVLDRAVLREVDIADFALLGRDKKPESPKARTGGCTKSPKVGCWHNLPAFETGAWKPRQPRSAQPARAARRARVLAARPRRQRHFRLHGRLQPPTQHMQRTRAHACAFTTLTAGERARSS